MIFSTKKISYAIDCQPGGVTVRFDEKVSEHLIVYVNGLIIGNSEFENIKYQVWDFTDVSEYVINSDKGSEVGALDKAASVWNRKVKVAIITINEALIEYVNEYIDEIADTLWECRTFSSLESAKDWAINE